ncbi:MAG: cytochrome c3 family protein [Deltaproteobacteria bacterium]|nr:cytochrome c3 family protein [Deltaproteobacteria bacterium]
MRKNLLKSGFLLLMALFLLYAGSVQSKAKKQTHPFDLFDHEMHTGIFEGVSFSCENCHADPESFQDRKKINRLGCHMCHNNPNPPVPGTQDCKVCHASGFPKPESHKTAWIAKHQTYAKQDPQYCTQCHSNAMFCVDCHQRRDTIQTKMHQRNFLFYHSIEARANPRKCDECHSINYCEQCHSGKGNSKK